MIGPETPTERRLRLIRGMSRPMLRRPFDHPALVRWASINSVSLVPSELEAERLRRWPWQRRRGAGS